MSTTLDTLVIGAGPAGLGTALALRAVDNLTYAVLERGHVGQTFLDWPTEQRFLTPSFTGNGFFATDLNAIHPNTSPAYTLGTDYPDGAAYARYLRVLARHYDVPVHEEATVTSVAANPDGFVVTTPEEVLRARTMVWAGGEFHDAVMRAAWRDLVDHASSPEAWSARSGHVVVVGGYESGVDLACHHVEQGAEVTMVDPAAPWKAHHHTADPSLMLSPRSRSRLREALLTGRVRVVDSAAARVSEQDGAYVIELADGTSLRSAQRPVAATGYGPGLGPVSRLFDTREDGWPLLDSDDQSTTTPGLFLSGPALRHDAMRFCFVYKFRQRFAHIAGVIGERLDKDVSGLKEWRDAGMLTDDLSCCGVECAC